MAQAVSVPNLDLETLRCEISKEYGEVASNPTKGFHFHTGRKLTKILGYTDDQLEGIPERSVEAFAGTGNPFSMGEIRPGEHVADIGSGAGIDSLIAARMTGPSGKVVGTDMTPEMLDRARAAATEAGFENVEFRQGHAESLPVPDGWADVIISNGVVNLCPDKLGLFREMHRVLKPGGRLQIGDILVEKPVPQSAKDRIELWTGWIAGALLEAELQAVVEEAGFENFAITWRDDVFKGAPQSSSAASFGTLGINYKARKPTE